MSRLVLGPTQPTGGLFLWGKAALRMKLTTHLSFTLRLQMCGAVPTIPLHVFMVCTGAAFLWHLFMNIEVTNFIHVTEHLQLSLHLILVMFLLACKYANFLSLLFTFNTSLLNMQHLHTLFTRRVNGIRPFRGYCETFIHLVFIIVFSFVNYLVTHLFVLF